MKTTIGDRLDRYTVTYPATWKIALVFECDDAQAQRVHDKIEQLMAEEDVLWSTVLESDDH